MVHSPIPEVVAHIVGLATAGNAVLVGIDGGAGAGKSTFSDWLAEQVGERGMTASVVRTDLIYRPVADRWAGPVETMPVGYNLHWERLRDEVILPLRAGRLARFQLYDWARDCLGEWVEIDARGVTIVDGVCALRNELAAHYDLRVWFSCPLETRVARLLSRGDTSQAEIDAWLPIEKRYQAAHTPKRSAHLVADSAGSMTPDGGIGWLKPVRWSPPDPSRP